MNFRDALITAYRQNPCQLLPNALWKTVALLDEWETAVSLNASQITHLEAWHKNKLFLLWDHNRHHTTATLNNLDTIEFALLHQDYIHLIAANQFPKREAYFRLINRSGSTKSVNLPPDFQITNVNTNMETELVAKLINKCYLDINMSTKTVESWLTHATFEPDLWIWIIDKTKGVPVGLGIAELDSTIAEGSLEWIQVFPDYRGHGIGTTIVQTLLDRLQNRAAFTTVAGQVNNTTNPEALYRRCGFEGNDIWWVLQENPE
ncbi:MAG: GNAT family N-acetyltransferase [Chloroflexi bacterium]|nr:GNAT family N-acetyltransferase [Chloroflexota bacterium]